LTSEEAFRAYTTNTSVGTGTIAFSFVDLATTKAIWDDALVRIRWEYAATTTPEAIRIDPFVPSIAVGAPLPTGTTAGGDGFWVGRETGVYKFRIGDPNGTRLQWNSAVLGLYDSSDTLTIALDGSGNSYFAGPMTIGSSGGIWQGTGTFSSPTTGIKLWNDGGVGRIASYASSTLQVGFDTSGNLTAGGGTVRLNANGLQIRGTNYALPYLEVTTQPNRLSFYDSGGSTLLGYIAGQTVTDQSEGLIISGGTDDDALFIYNSLDHKWRATNDILIEPNTGDGSGFVTVSGSITLAKGLRIGNEEQSINIGQFLSDVQGAANYQAVLLMDTTDVAHGMTAIAHTSTYGRLGKDSDTNGVLLIDGFGEAGNAINLHGYATTENTGKSTGSTGGVNINAFLKSGTGGGSYGSTGNIFVVRNNSQAQMILAGNGDLHVNGSGSLSTYDDFEDAELIRAADLTLAGQIDAVFGEMVRYGRADLEAAGLISSDNFVNVTGMQRLLMGNAWQQHERIRALETRIQELESERT
jgi:hypothetical protein